ncbi:MAG: hypothetical protein HKO65_06460 [Gemmatimonadetes bacterium]|nr:hypothetical protein [Gemmatimonadota bacterium]NNM04730.1 hypothetical protein [Gemmatimonadota bacterium]
MRFTSERRGQPFALVVALGFTLLSAWALVAGIGPTASALLGLIVFGSLSASGSYSLLTGRGRNLQGLLIDQSGLSDHSTGYPIGRMTWDEVREVVPFSRSFLGYHRPGHWIGLNVTDAFLDRRSKWTRLQVWMNRKLFRMPDLLISASNLKGGRKEIMEEMQGRLTAHQLRAVAEIKELESGSES